jgi:hypothetical protein
MASIFSQPDELETESSGSLGGEEIELVAV